MLLSNARTAGRVLYDIYQHSRPEMDQGGWSLRGDGVTEDHSSKVEITPDGDIFGRHADLTEYLRRAALTGSRKQGEANFESHHLVPAEVLRTFGIDEKDGIAVAVDWQGHIDDIYGYAALSR